MKTKKTAWFDKDLPARVGVYEVRWRNGYPLLGSPTGEYFAYWDGNYWGWVSMAMEDALEASMSISTRYVADAIIWRGLCVGASTARSEGQAQ